MFVAVTRLRFKEQRLPRDQLGAPVHGYLQIWWVDRPGNNGSRCMAALTTDVDGMADRILQMDEVQIRRWSPRGWVLRGVEPGRFRDAPTERQAWWCHPPFSERHPNEIRSISLDDARWTILQQLGRTWLENQLDALVKAPRV